MESRRNWGSQDFHPGSTAEVWTCLAGYYISLGLGVKTQQHEGGWDSSHFGDGKKHNNLSHGPGELLQHNSLRLLISEVFDTCVCK